MARNPYAGLDQQHEQTLGRIERKYDKDTAHTREYYGTLADIHNLVQARKIDPEHGRFLAAGAKEVFDQAEAKLKARRIEKRVRAGSGKVYGYVLLGFALFMVLFWLFLSHSFGG